MSEPKILIYDIETSPLRGLSWGVRDIDIVHLEDKSYVLTVAWQWFGENKIHVRTAPYKKDKQICKDLAKQVSKADLVIFQNGDAFDERVLRTRLLDHGIPQFAPTASVDTLKVFRRYFRFPANSLDAVCSYLGIGKKLKHPGIQMWIDYMKGSKKAKKTMAKYNQHDVWLTTEVYKRIRSVIQNHPSLSILKREDKEGCPVCGSKNTQYRGFHVTTKTKQRRFQCQDCGHWGKARITKKKKK